MSEGKRVCVVAGVGPGVGLAVARRFGKGGFRLALIARDLGKLSGYVDALRSEGFEATAFPVDLADQEAIRATIGRIEFELGSVRVLVYNAASWIEHSAMSIPAADFAQQLAVSVTGALVSAQSVFPAMKSAGEGTILFTGGGLALKPEYGHGVAALTAGKSALRGLTYAMANELAADKVHLATVTIAGVVTPGTAFDPDQIAEAYWDLYSEPIGRWSVEKVFSGDPH